MNNLKRIQKQIYSSRKTLLEYMKGKWTTKSHRNQEKALAV